MTKWKIFGVGIQKYATWFNVEADTEEEARKIAELEMEEMSWDYFEREDYSTHVASITKVESNG